VQLIGQVERHALGPLRFHDDLILAEDRVFEFAQDAAWLIEIVIPADDHVPRAAIRADRLGREEVNHAPRTAPAEAQDDRVGQMQLIRAAPLRRSGLGVREHREVVAVRRLWPDDRVVQDVAIGADFVLGHDRPVRVAE
jgi:hypothetical protein